MEPLNIDGKGLFKLLQKTMRTKPESFAKINEHLQLLEWFEGFEIPNDLMFTERRINIKDQFIDGVQFIDQRSANEGFLYLLFYLTLFISDDTPKFFAIDNIDNAMNPKLGSELIRILSKLAKEHDKQVILTTHNPSVLDGLDLSDDEQRLFVISRNKSGHTQAIRVPHRESEERLSTRFIRGSIGGLPKNF
jgi:AAA15 family ATPase/GTPase